MQRSSRTEILDDPTVPEEIRFRCYRELTNVHSRVGNIRAVVKCLHNDPQPVRRILDLGCGYGGVLARICHRLQISGVGLDLLPPPNPPVTILRMDAVREILPEADVAIAIAMTHHLTETECIQLIRNVRRSCRRLIILDLVRHPLPAFVFRFLVAPFVHRVTAADGLLSFARAFTFDEMRSIATQAVSGTPDLVRHTIDPLYIRQIVDITFVRQPTFGIRTDAPEF